MSVTDWLPFVLCALAALAVFVFGLWLGVRGMVRDVRAIIARRPAWRPGDAPAPERLGVDTMRAGVLMFAALALLQWSRVRLPHIADVAR